MHSLKNTISLRGSESGVSRQSPETSFKSEGIFNEEDFLNQEMLQLRTSCAGGNDLRRAKGSLDLRKNDVPAQQQTCGLKPPGQSLQRQDSRSSDKKRRNSFLKKVLQEIKHGRSQHPKPPEQVQPEPQKAEAQMDSSCSSELLESAAEREPLARVGPTPSPDAEC